MSVANKTSIKENERMVKREHQRMKNADATQYLYIDVPRLLAGQKKAARLGRAIGTCLEENAELHSRLMFARPELQPKLIKMIYVNTEKRRQEQYHAYLLVKINNVWYVRDKSNSVDCQIELNNWLVRRMGMGSIPTEFHEIECSRVATDKKTLTTYNVRNPQKFDYEKYYKHNRIVLKCRGDWNGDHLRCIIPEEDLP